MALTGAQLARTNRPPDPLASRFAARLRVHEQTQLDLIREELEWLLFNLRDAQGTLKKGPGLLDVIVDDVGFGLYEKVVELAKREGLDAGS